MLAITGREQRDDAFVIRRASHVMDLFVQLRDRGKNDREEESADASGGYDHPERDLFGVVASPAHVLGILSPRGESRKRHSGSNWTPSPEWLTDAQHL